MKKNRPTKPSVPCDVPTRDVQSASIPQQSTFSWNAIYANDRFQWVELGLFLLFAWWFFGWRYADFLYFAQNNDLFLYDSGYFAAHLAELGGLHDYLISFVMQFFYLPFWGGLILAILATCIVAMTASLLRLRGIFYPLAMIPAALVLIFVARIGYMLVEFMLFRFCFGMLTGVAAALALGLVSSFFCPLKPIQSPSATEQSLAFSTVLRQRFWIDTCVLCVSYPIFGGFAILGGIIAWFRSVQDTLSRSARPSTGSVTTQSASTAELRTTESVQATESVSIWRLHSMLFAGRLALLALLPIFYYECFYVHHIAWPRLWSVGLETEGSPITDLIGTSNLFRSFAIVPLLALAVMMAFFIAIQWTVSKRKPTAATRMCSAQTSGQFTRNGSLLRLIPLLAILALFGVTLRYDCPDSTFLPSLAMGRAMESQQWQNVIEYENRSEHSSFPMIALRNLALFELDESANWFFSYPQTTTEPMIGRIYTDEILYRYGMLNHSQRAAMNQLVMNDYLAVGPLRVLASVAVAQRNPALARRYLRLLDRTLFHRTWARWWEAILEKELSEQACVPQASDSQTSATPGTPSGSTESQGTPIADASPDQQSLPYSESLEAAKLDLARIRRRIPVTDFFNRGTQAQAILWGRMLRQPHDPQDAPEIQELQLVYRLMVGEMDEFIRQLESVFRAKNEDPILNPTKQPHTMPRHFQEALLLWLFRHPEISTVDRSAFSSDILEEYRICEPFLIQHRQTNDLRTLQKQLHEYLPRTYWRFGSEKLAFPFDRQVN